MGSKAHSKKLRRSEALDDFLSKPYIIRCIHFSAAQKAACRSFAMPIYEYQCEGCSEVFEVFQKHTDPAPASHACGSTKVRRVLSNTSFRLKGTGWYATDYGNKSAPPTKEGAGSHGSHKKDAEGKASSEAGKSADSSSETKAKSGEGSAGSGSSGSEAKPGPGPSGGSSSKNGGGGTAAA